MGLITHSNSVLFPATIVIEAGAGTAETILPATNVPAVDDPIWLVVAPPLVTLGLDTYMNALLAALVIVVQLAPPLLEYSSDSLMVCVAVELFCNSILPLITEIVSLSVIAIFSLAFQVAAVSFPSSFRHRYLVCVIKEVGSAYSSIEHRMKLSASSVFFIILVLDSKQYLIQ